MHIFQTYFRKRNFRSLWQTKYVKLCGDEKFQLEERNTIIIFQRTIMVATCDAFGCTYFCKKYPRVEFFTGFLPQMLKSSDFDRDRCRTFIVQLPWQKMKTFLFARIISGKMWTILYLFPCLGNSQMVLKALHRQSVLLASIPTQTIFLTCLNLLINNLCLATFVFQFSHSPCFKSSINYLSYWS